MYKHITGTGENRRPKYNFKQQPTEQLKKQSQKGHQSLPASILYPKNRAAIRTASTDTDARAITMVSSR